MKLTKILEEVPQNQSVRVNILEQLIKLGTLRMP